MRRLRKRLKEENREEHYNEEDEEHNEEDDKEEDEEADSESGDESGSGEVQQRIASFTSHLKNITKHILYLRVFRALTSGFVYLALSQCINGNRRTYVVGINFGNTM